jgi:hypothetical protein
MLFLRFSTSTRASTSPSQAAKTFFLKNAGILRNPTRAETSAEMTLREQLAGEQESRSEFVELVDELKVRTKKG